MSEEAIFDALLGEAAGDDAPDVTGAVLQAAVAEGSVTGFLEAAPEFDGAVALPKPEIKAGRLVAIVGWGAAACAAVAIAWILLVWDTPGGTGDPAPIERELPEAVALVGGDFEYEGDVLRIGEGLAVVREGAPPLRVADATIENVKGVALVRRGQAPGEDELAEYSRSLRSGASLKPEELEMLKHRKWIVRGGVAVCVLAGSMALNGDIIEAQAVKVVELEDVERAESVGERTAMLMDEWDTNEDGVISSDEYREELEMYDLNGNKEVTEQEIDQFYRALIEGAERRVAERVAEAKAELEKKAGEAGNKKAGDFMGKLDKNGDGKVDADEAKGLGAEATSWMKKLDGDNDGEISKKEAEEYFKAESLEEEKAAARKKDPLAVRDLQGIEVLPPGKEDSPGDPDTGAEEE